MGTIYVKIDPIDKIVEKFTSHNIVFLSKF